MADTDRRTFLKLMGTGAVAVAVPPSIRKAVAVPAHNKTKSIGDVEHIVFLMQENRSFDHYFGTLKGVRGFNDPHPITLPSGRPVWNQPYSGGELLPFRPDVADMGKTFLPDPPHGWTDTHAAWNGGRMDQFVPNKGLDTMTYHTRNDIPYQYALADAFTICDAYHCSLLGPTDPNRYHMWTGWVGNDGAGGGPVVANDEAGYDWSTYPERLERNGISWKVYQDIGVGLDAAGSWGWTGDRPYIGNYGDNALLYFHQYQNAQPGNPLADKAKIGTNVGRTVEPNSLFEIFKADVESGDLPQVSWIVAPEAYTEHPNWMPDFGAWYVSNVVDILADNPDVWSKTVLFVTYDEEGGFFDHMPPPVPPASPTLGGSTVTIVNEIHPGSSRFAAGPYGLGMRVPMIVVSPWSRGGYVNSQLFDHTSLIRFVEARFGQGNSDLVESNITPWRRAVVGDLTTTFDFRDPNDRFPRLPDTSAFKPVTFVKYPDLDVVAPATSARPPQERGVKPARALPYSLQAHATVAGDGSVRIDFANRGDQAAVFQVWSANPADAPRSYTVEAGTRLAGAWAPGPGGYDLTVQGPNGFVRRFQGADGPGRARLDVVADEHGDDLTVTITNPANQRTTVRLTDHYSGERTDRQLPARGTWTKQVSTNRLFGWYDLTVTALSDAGFAYHLAGHVEDGKDSASDPGMGGLVGLHP